MHLTDALAAALTPDRRRPIPGAAPILAAVTARHLVQVLLANGYVRYYVAPATTAIRP